jgi:hypothetical protein
MEGMAQGGMEAQGGEVRVGKRCFVGNLAWRTSWQDLKVWQDGDLQVLAADIAITSLASCLLGLAGQVPRVRQCCLHQRDAR